MPETVYRSVGVSTSTAVIWFIVRVPVLSELIAEVNARVSTDGSSFTMAFRCARLRLPTERIAWVTVGSASGMAAMASETALTNRTSQAWSRLRPRANITIMVSPAAPVIHRVRRSSSRVSGGTSFSVTESMPEILPSSVSAPVPVTTTRPLPWVTGVFMNAMLVRSPGGGRRPPGRVPESFAAGTLSPVSADSSIWRALASMMRPSAGTWSPAAISTTSPTTSSSAGTSASAPSLRTRAVVFIIDFSAFIALSALPSWRSPTTAFTKVRTMRSIPVVHSWMIRETAAATTRTICM